MRALFVAGLLLGACYNPSTASCYYQCATQGTPCPSGLECLAGAGMCVTPGTTTCAADGDGGADSSIDGARPMCGDSIVTAGEVCFDPPIALTPAGTPTDARFADVDGDGDLDVVYMNGSAYQIHYVTSGVFATAMSGPPTPNSTAMQIAQLNMTPATELIDLTPAQVHTWTFSGQFSQVGSFNLLPAGSGLPVATAVGRVRNQDAADLAVLFGNQLRLLHYDPTLQISEDLQYAVSAGTDVAIGRIGSDAFADVVVSTQAGIVRWPGVTGGLGTVTGTSVTTPVHGIEIADIDNDGFGDVVYVVTTATGGGLGVMRGKADGSLFAPTFVPIADLSKALEVADIDRDGRSDVIAYRQTAPKAILVALGKADGTLAAPIEVPLASQASRIFAGDFNRDTVPDLLVSDPAQGALVVLPSNP